MVCARWGFVNDNALSRRENETLIWKPNSIGTFSTKSARNAASYWSVASYVWKSYLPPKLSIFAWKLWHKGVPTDNNVRRCGINLASKCSCCENPHEETAEHLFSYSEIAKVTCAHLEKLFGIRKRDNISWKCRALYWWEKTRGKNQVNLIASATPIFIIWEIWPSRNANRFEGVKVNSSTVIHKVLQWIRDISFFIEPKYNLKMGDKEILNFLQIAVKSIRVKKPFLVKWEAPKSGLKLNIDGSSLGNPGAAGAGGVIRDSEGCVVLAFSEFLGSNTNNYAETQALLSGVNICYQLDIHSITIESDSMLLVNWFKGNSKLPWNLLDLWEKIMEWAQYVDISVEHKYREGNALADGLAKEGSKGRSEVYGSVIDLPNAAYGAWFMDRMGTPSWRNG